ncbi:MAG TPA: cardiolipin synthase [Aestuariivirga sp.]|nr:cardiolipin synthase [Aestuariivirga sp.]
MTNVTLYALVIGLLHVAFLIRAILRPNREPASRVAWALVILAAPVAGMIAYILLGETNVGRGRRLRERKALALFPPMASSPGLGPSVPPPVIPDRHLALFATGRAINGFAPVGGNDVQLLADSNAAIDAMVADIDQARDHVHISFYIWLADTNGLKMVEALIRARQRGIACRIIADGLGSRRLIGSEHWRRMAAAGVETVAALRVGNPLLRALNGRIDIRNHRKIVVIDNRITYCGSQNCADPEFRIKARYAPWVDIMMRFEGPVARQNQYLFASQWMASSAGDLTHYLREPLDPGTPGVVAQATGTGPTVPFSAMPALFAALIFEARRELFVTTPYYVPNEMLQAALCACARRGVAVTMIFPARNDSRIVAAASRSYYLDLLEAGVTIFEYGAGLLHAKTMTVDGEVALIGSANLDRRSFDLNFENNILISDEGAATVVRQRQETYLAQSRRITREEVQGWSMPRRLYNNTIAMLSPLL